MHEWWEERRSPDQQAVDKPASWKRRALFKAEIFSECSRCEAAVIQASTLTAVVILSCKRWLISVSTGLRCVQRVLGRDVPSPPCWAVMLPPDGITAHVSGALSLNVSLNVSLSVSPERWREALLRCVCVTV